MMSSAGEDQGSDSWSGARVLLVDDEEPVARRVAGPLRRGGFEVEVARSADQPVAEIQTEGGRQLDPRLARAAGSPSVGAGDLAS